MKKPWFEIMLLKIISQLRNLDVTKWEAIKREVAKKNLLITPEIRVVESLRAYLDGVWAGPQEAKRLWNNVLLELKDLDVNEANRIENRISSSRITDSVEDWRKNNAG